MTRTIPCGIRHGSVRIPASKSQAHRLLICAALGRAPVAIDCDGISKDIAATMDCLRALGADIREENGSLAVTPITSVPETTCHLPCGESGSTLRFLLPVVGTLGADAVFHMEGRLPQRPLSPLDAVLTSHGMNILQDGNLLYCSGRLCSGEYTLPGNVSSQYISGLLMALPRLTGDSTLEITGTIESAAYITMTEDALRLSGIRFEKNNAAYRIPGGQRSTLPARCAVEGDYSNAAFFLCAGALSPEGITVRGLSSASSQGDRVVLDILRCFGAKVTESAEGILVRKQTLRGIEIDAAPVPDLIPVLSVVAAAAEGETRIFNAGRLRLKESDRLKSTADLLQRLGAEVTELEEGLLIRGGRPLSGGTVDPWGDHRIAMSAAVAACAATGDVTVTDSLCVQKSYPRFWDDFAALKGATS